MSCRQIDLGPGVTSFACTRGSRKVTCAYCKSREAVYLCDYELRGARAGETCDGRLCASCATLIAENRHLCPPHRRERDAQLAKERDADAWLSQLASESQASQGLAEVTASQDAAVPREDPTRGEDVLGDAPWSELPDDPPVNALAAELRARRDSPASHDVEARALSIANDNPEREQAVLLSMRQDTPRDRPCNACGGDVVIVKGRAWCVKRYADGGCGRSWNVEAKRQIEGELRLAFAADESRELRDRELRQRAGVPIAEKVAHVRGARQTRNHGCHWPGCEQQVPPAMWGCKPHWMQLPRRIRDRIWNAYAPGQENTLSPSSEYLEAVDEAQRWIRQHLASLAETDAPPRRPGWDEVVREARSRDHVRGAPEVEDRPAPPRPRRAEQLALDVATSERMPWDED